MADLLAAVADLEKVMQRTLTANTATVLLEGATAAVQAVTGQRLVQVADDEITIEVDDLTGVHLSLPERPVTAVTSVEIGATAVTDYTAQLGHGRLYRVAGWRSAALLPDPGAPSTVTVTYSHGYAPTDQRLQLARSVTLLLAAAAYSNPGGATRVQTGSVSASYDDTFARLGASPALTRQLRARYARPSNSIPLATPR